MRVRLFLFTSVIFSFLPLLLSILSRNQINISSLVPFSFQIVVILKVILSDNRLIDKKATSSLIVGYSFLMLLCFKANYFFLNGSLFEPSAVDSLQYWNITKEYSHYSLIDAIKMFIQREDIEDLGAFFWYSVSYRLYPSIFSYNILLLLFHLLTIIISFKSLEFFGVNKYLYPTILFSLNGASIYLISTGMKEVAFAFHISLVFYFLLLSQRKRYTYLFPFLFCLTTIYFFRPMVMLFIVFSTLIGFWVGLSRRMRILSFICVICIGWNMTISDLFLQKLLYLSPDVVAQKQNLSPSLFNYLMSFLSILGPFPSFQLFSGSEQQLWYGAGLMVKLAFVLPFINGLVGAWRSKQVVLVAIGAFVLLNSVALAMILESFEYRLQYPHIPSFFLIAIYGISNGLDKIKMVVTHIAMFSLMFLWNLRFYF